jgi:UDP-glucose 4-epimerase
MADDIFRTVRELLESSDCVLMGNAVNTEGKLYDDSVANLTAILAMQERYDAMQTAFSSMVVNYAQFGRVTEHFIRDVSRMLGETSLLLEEIGE